MEQVRTFCRRYRRLLMAAAYLLIFAVGVLYLRVTISIPPEGDDKLTLNKWLFDLHRMPYARFFCRICRAVCGISPCRSRGFSPFTTPTPWHCCSMAV